MGHLEVRRGENIGEPGRWSSKPRPLSDLEFPCRYGGDVQQFRVVVEEWRSKTQLGICRAGQFGLIRVSTLSLLPSPYLTLDPYEAIIASPESLITIGLRAGCTMYQ